MNQIIPFEQMNQYPVQYEGDFDLNAGAEEFASVKFPVISVKNARFHVKREGTKTLILRPKNKPTDPDEPASYIDMVVLNLQKSKTFYADGWTEGSEEKPDCFSNDGTRPDVSAQDPQCTTCALCPHNAWGSGVNEKGEATKGKACSDVLRLAVASPANLEEVFMFRVPPASLKNFAEVSKLLSSKRVPVNAAVIRIAPDSDKTGVITFQAIGGLDAATYAKASAMKSNDLVLAITGKSHQNPAPAGQIAAPAAKPEVAVDPEEAKKKAKAEAKAKKLAAAKAALAAAEADEEEAPVEPAAKPEKSTMATTTSSNFDAELAALIG